MMSPGMLSVRPNPRRNRTPVACRVLVAALVVRHWSLDAQRQVGLVCELAHLGPRRPGAADLVISGLVTGDSVLALTGSDGALF